MENRLMKLFDKRYDEIFHKIHLKVSDNETAKKIMGQIFKDSWDRLTTKKVNDGNVQSVFAQVVLSYGIS